MLKKMTILMRNAIICDKNEAEKNELIPPFPQRNTIELKGVTNSFDTHITRVQRETTDDE